MSRYAVYMLQGPEILVTTMFSGYTNNMIIYNFCKWEDEQEMEGEVRKREGK